MGALKAVPPRVSLEFLSLSRAPVWSPLKGIYGGVPLDGKLYPRSLAGGTMEGIPLRGSLGWVPLDCVP
jgi:hypothetical protein